MNLSALLMSFSLLCGADSATTHLALHVGGREVHLPTQNPYVIHAYNAGVVATVDTLAPKLATRHKVLTSILVAALVAERAAAVGHNMSELRHRGR